jgi:hypothetical protein
MMGIKTVNQDLAELTGLFIHKTAYSNYDTLPKMCQTRSNKRARLDLIEGIL